MTPPARYRKKPVEIEAMQWDPESEQALGWGREAGADFVHDLNTGELEIPTLEGTMRAAPGDWVIRGVEGEFYPCKPSIFEATYEGPRV